METLSREKSYLRTKFNTFSMDKKHFLTLLWLCMASTQLWAVILVSCVGNSITEGV